MYAQQQDGNWRELLGNIVFSLTVYQSAESLSDEQRQEFGVYLIQDIEPPTLSATQKLSDPVFTINGNVVERTYPVVDKTADEIAQETSNKAAQIRALRNTKLTESDWTQLPDNTVDKAAWASYRQGLRDISLQSGFPWDITWPTQPGT
jgi:Phage tail assembly chaperone protein